MCDSYLYSLPMYMYTSSLHVCMYVYSYYTRRYVRTYLRTCVHMYGILVVVGQLRQLYTCLCRLYQSSLYTVDVHFFQGITCLHICELGCYCISYGSFVAMMCYYTYTVLNAKKKNRS